MLLWSWKSLSSEQRLDLDKVAVIDSVYYPNRYNPFVSGDVFPFLRIGRENDTMVYLQFDLKTTHEDSLFFVHDGLESRGLGRFDPTYLDIVDIQSDFIDLKYSSRNPDYEGKMRSAQLLSSGILVMYLGVFRATYSENKISIDCFLNEQDKPLKVCDYVVIGE